MIKKSKKPNLLFVYVLLLVIGVALMLLHKIRNPNTNKPTNSTINYPATPTNKSSASPILSNTTNYFLIKVNKSPARPKILEKYSLEYNISTLLNLPIDYGGYGSSVGNIVFNIDDGNPYKEENTGSLRASMFDFNYYVVIPGYDFVPGEYRNEDASIKIDRVDPKFIPYINDPDYCTVDNDCVIRKNLCEYGSFNKFYKYSETWWDCGPYSDFYDSESKNWFGSYDYEKGCTSNITYKSSKCIQNKCIGQGMKLSCSKS